MIPRPPTSPLECALVSVDKIDECAAANVRKIPYNLLNWLIVHRISLSKKEPENPYPIPDSVLNGAALTRVFRNHAMGTGGKTPYTLLLKTDGVCEQIIPLYTAGAHAAKYNRVSIGLAVVYRPGGSLTDAQKVALPYIFLSLIPLIVGGLACAGHTELPSASMDSDKVCPHFSWKEFEYAGRAMLPIDWREWDLSTRESWAMARGFVLQRSASTPRIA